MIVLDASSERAAEAGGGPAHRLTSHGQFLEELEVLPAERYSHTPSLGRMWV
jgi:hypothetical protein